MENKIREIRDRFESDLEQKASLYHRVDIARVRTEDWQIKRYLLDCNENVDTAYANLLKTLVWKNEFGVHELSEKNCPKELYELYQVEIYGRDKEGRPIFSEGYNQKFFKELDHVMRKMIVFQLEKSDRLVTNEKGSVYIGNFTDISLSNLNLPLAKFKIDCLNAHYPLLAQKQYLLNVPLLVKPFIKLIVSFMKPSVRDSVFNVNFEELTQYIDADVLPRELGGRRIKRHYPEDAASMRRDAAQLQLSTEFVEQFYKHHKLN